VYELVVKGGEHDSKLRELGVGDPVPEPLFLSLLTQCML
jgi:hypothetical protein